MTSIQQATDIMKKIKYPSYEKDGDDEEFYHICLKYLCKNFERHIIFKVGLMIVERGGVNALHKCIKQLATLAKEEVKKSKKTETEKIDVVRLVSKTVSDIWLCNSLFR